jgi:hypothetical protein
MTGEDSTGTPEPYREYLRVPDELHLDRSASGFAARLAADQTSSSGHAERNEELHRKAGDFTAIDGASLGCRPRSSGASPRPGGEGNEAELRREGRVLRFLLNGREVNGVDADRAIVCHPGLQAHGTDIRYRNMVMTPLKAGVPPGPRARRVDRRKSRPETYLQFGHADPAFSAKSSSSL